MGRRPSEAKRALWQERILRWRESGLSAAEFCRRESLGLASFYSWRRRLEASVSGAEAPRPTRRDAKPSAFLRLEVVDRPSPDIAELRLAGGDTLRVPVGCDPQWLAELLRALEARKRNERGLGSAAQLIGRAGQATA